MAKIKIKKTPEQLALIKAMASRDLSEAHQAQAALAMWLGSVLKEYIDLAPTIGNLYSQIEVSEFEPQSIPLDMFHDVTEADYYRVIMQSTAGGLATNFDVQTDEVYFRTYDLTSAVSMYTKYIRAGRLDVVSKALNHMANEILKKREVTSVSPILYAIANETTNGLQHVFRTNTADQLVLDDFVKLLARTSRLFTATVGGTPMDASSSITDCIISPEMLAEIRGMAYNPQNVRAVPNTDESTAMPAPESFRDEVFRSAGIPTFYDINFLVANELGVGQAYNTIFDTYAGSTSYTKYDGTSGAVFAATDELIIGINARGDALVKPVITDGENGQGLNVFPDGQFTNRSKKVGFYAEIQEGALILDTRYLSGLIV